MEPGEFSVRGSMVDIVPAGSSEGYRLDFFGDEIETIRQFEPLNQVSTGKADRMVLHPVSEVILNDASLNRFRQRYRELFGAVSRDDALYEALAAGHSFPGMEHWLPLFHEELETLPSYLPNHAAIAFEYGVAEAAAEREELIHEYYDARKNAENTGKGKLQSYAAYHPVPPEQMFLSLEQLSHIVGQHGILLTPFQQEGAAGKVEPFHGQKTRNFVAERKQGAASLFEAVKAQLEADFTSKRRTLVACYTEGSRERVKTLCSEHGIAVKPVESWQEAHKLPAGITGLGLLALEQGFTTPKFALYSEQDLLGERIIRAQKKKKASEIFLAEAANFDEGQYVVHAEHGIGRFEGLVTVEAGGALHDCLKIIYEGDDKLFVPVENIELVTAFGDTEGDIKLDKLGSAAWQNRKARMKERIRMAADELLKIAAERALKTAPHLHATPGMYDEFVSRFPYAETEDQLNAINEVFEDLTQGKPMDRLICGDVGFGKTEVALRAAFAAVFAEEGRRQVAVIAPTTLLCRQHFHTFTKRFDGLPVTIRQLSRLVTAKEATATRESLQKGEVDIVIGTHALLSEQVKFKDLALVIVDEEQHFGVKQKEKLKNLRSEVHVLTLSATPIPRTLQLALSGVRELSLITTPPVDRLAVRTFVMPVDPVVLREAILREFHRGGKTFYVTPRIKDIPELTAMLKELVPEVRIAVAHGQMPASELDKIMNAFYDGHYDVLLSTSIIESGIDIPTANTMIVNRADMFGLSQLYQLRGRVGRGKTRAYAYFTLPHRRTLSHNAYRRLEVLQTLDTLGAGFQLASHDMDIRGFGNLLGEEQSGHIREVGVELYQQMLEDAITAARRRLKDQQAAEQAQLQAEALASEGEQWSPQINLGMSVLIPESYVPDLSLRLGLYRRAASLPTEEDLHSFAAELVDRFGPRPEEVDHLLAIVRLKQLCRRAGVEKLDAGPKGAVLTFRNNVFARPDALIQYVTRNARTLKIRGDQKLVIMKEWVNEEAKMKGLRESVSEIVALAA
jgi:transcription-repair coupling factor (superfamily II helicase)